MNSEIAMVSAIMPTRGRTGWATDAVRMFLAQTWPAKELVIIDDRNDPSFLHGCTDPTVKYWIEPSFNIGMKRNLAISRSVGAIVMHWDSDDIYAPERMAEQANLLIETGADLVGYYAMEFIDVAGPRYLYRANCAYAIGVSQTYWMETWQTRPFQLLETGEDSAFLVGRNIVCCPAKNRIIARIHSGNTSDKRRWIGLAPQQWHRIDGPLTEAEWQALET